MQDRLRSYLILCGLGFVCAVGVTALVCVSVPVTRNPWIDISWFILFATLAELLPVGIATGTASRNDVEITPSSPVYWAATCVLGPFPAIVICVVSAIVSSWLRCAAYYGAQALAPASEAAPSQAERGSPGIGFLVSTLLTVGGNWRARTIAATIQGMTLYVSNIIMIVGLAGLVYHLLGGVFLTDWTRDSGVVRNFVLPFVGLVAAAIFTEHGHNVAVMAAIYPMEGMRGIRGILVRMKIVMIETTMPLGRAQLFLVVVALLLAYLYGHVGALGFVMAAMPVLALRDFFGQWMAERSAYLDTITTLATYMQLYHPYTRGHLKRVADMSERLARELKLPAESIMHMSTAGFLHDIGKIGVSEEILDKVEKLTDEEWAQIREHPVKGAEIVSHIEFLDGIVGWIKYHHKWYNGQGYPKTNGNGAEIPMQASIIAVADAFDAMTDDRELAREWKCDSCDFKPDGNLRPEKCPICGAVKTRIFREPKPLDEAIDELRRGAGTQFDPKVVKAFLSMVQRDGIHLHV